MNRTGTLTEKSLSKSTGHFSSSFLQFSGRFLLHSALDTCVGFILITDILFLSEPPHTHTHISPPLCTCLIHLSLKNGSHHIHHRHEDHVHWPAMCQALAVSLNLLSLSSGSRRNGSLQSLPGKRRQMVRCTCSDIKLWPRCLLLSPAFFNP